MQKEGWTKFLSGCPDSNHPDFTDYLDTISCCWRAPLKIRIDVVVLFMAGRYFHGIPHQKGNIMNNRRGLTAVGDVDYVFPERYACAGESGKW